MLFIISWSIGQCYSGTSLYLRDTNFIITVPADGLAPYGARPLAGAVLMIKLNMFSAKFLWIPVILLSLSTDDIQNCDKISWNLLTLVLSVKIELIFFSLCNPIHYCHVSGHSGCCWPGQQSSGNQPQLLRGLLCTGTGQTRWQVGK